MRIAVANWSNRRFGGTGTYLTELFTSLQRQGHELSLRAGIDNATNLRLAAKSPLFAYEELPRSLRVGLEARW